MAPKKESKSEFSFSRTFDAPKDLVYEIWLDPEHIKQWLAPGGMTTIFKKVDVRPGGTSLYCMSTPDMKMWGKITYKEIQKTDRLVYVQAFSDENGGSGRHPMAPQFPSEMLTTVLFESVGKKTKISLTWSPLNATDEEIAFFEKEKPGMNQGWGGSFAQLDAYLTKIKSL